ncbi:MAG: M16 family metallopeptidase [Myxococcaceae bacterium]
MRRALVAAVCLLATGCSFAPPKPDLELPLPPEKPQADAGPAATIPGEGVLAQRPAIPPLGPFEAPVPTVITLQNGLKLYVVERRSAGLEALAFITRHGAAADPSGKEGLASLAAEMLQAGSAGKSQAEVAAAADAMGANLAVFASTDALSIGLSALAPRLGEMSALLADVALRPNLKPSDWKKAQGQRLGELTAAESEPEVAARAALLAALYGNGPLGHLPQGTLGSVKRLRLTDVKSFLASVAPEDSAIVAVGSASAGTVRSALDGAFGSWKVAGRVSTQRPLQTQPLTWPRFVLVNFPDKPQSVVLVGQPSVPRSSPDVLALELANTIVGGSFTSRLNQNLREQHGYSYGAFSAFLFGRGPGPFGVQTSVQTDVTGKAVAEVFNELNRMVAEPLSTEEVSKGKALLAFQLVENLQSVAATTRAVGNIFLFDLPLDEYRTFVSRLEALTPATVQEAVRRTLHPEGMALAIAGDAKVILPQLKAEAALNLPSPQLRDAEGKLLGKSKPVASAAAASVGSQPPPHP